jgi:hypothetical protein
MQSGISYVRALAHSLFHERPPIPISGVVAAADGFWGTDTNNKFMNDILKPLMGNNSVIAKGLCLAAGSACCLEVDWAIASAQDMVNASCRRAANRA